MSFQEQERAMFDLLFDRSLRADFTNNPAQALASYELNEAEQEDFSYVRPDALEMDARMRVYLLLSHWSKSFPVTFSIVSSLNDGIDALKSLVDSEIMRTAPVDRMASYGSRLTNWLETATFDSADEQTMAVAILGAEFGMVWAAASLKRTVLKGELPGIHQSINRPEVSAEWMSRPVRFSSYVCAVLIPQSYTQLKNKLCPCIDDGFWRKLSSHPLSREQVGDTFQKEDPRLLVTRAVLARESDCEPAVEFSTIELSEGFAPLFQHINGTTSVGYILEQLELAGAEAVMLKGVGEGFYQLLERGMLELG